MSGNILELYFHSAPKGRKIDVLNRTGNVCFEISCASEPVHSGYYFASVIGFGKTRFVENIDEKRNALFIMFKHQTGKSLRLPPSKLQ